MYCKGISLKHRWDHMLQMHRAPFPKCKCESERKCRNSISGWSSTTLQSSSVWIMVSTPHAAATRGPGRPSPDNVCRWNNMVRGASVGDQLGRACMKWWRAMDRRGRLFPIAVCPHDSLHLGSSAVCYRALTQPWANRTGFCRPAHAMRTCARAASARLAWSTLTGIDTGSAHGINTAHLFTLNSSSHKCSIWIKPL